MSKPKGARLNGFAVTENDINSLLMRKKMLLREGLSVDVSLGRNGVGHFCHEQKDVATFEAWVSGALWAAKAVKR
jgi:hypothetical protein